MRGELKIRPEQLSKMAYIYVRQSSPGQVLNHPESARMQRDLVRRAAGLGWPSSKIAVLDADLGKSGRFSANREDFKRIVGDVGAGEVGIVLGTSVNRLARNSADWFPLVEMCALTRTLIGDDDGVYDPNDPNDRLILGVKGTLSEAELGSIRARLHGAKWSLARRAELRRKLPSGYVWDDREGVVMDPDERVRSAIRLFFVKYDEVGSATGVARGYDKDGILFPCRNARGKWDAHVEWRALSVRRATCILHSPLYAGAYFYGQYRAETIVDPKTLTKKTVMKKIPMASWKVLIRDSHPAYISWEDFQRNQERLKENSKVPPGGVGSPRSGKALLQGIVYCSRCDRAMAVKYSGRDAKGLYTCCRTLATGRANYCQSVTAERIDRWVTEKIFEALQPVGIKAAFAAVDELEKRSIELKRQWENRIQQAEYEAALARRRYEAVDPDNRLVAGNLERDWEAKLSKVEEAKRDCRERMSRPPILIIENDRQRLRRLTQDIPRLWRSKKTKQSDRKRIVRILVREIWLAQEDPPRRIRVRIHWRSGAVTEATLDRPSPMGAHNHTPEGVVKAVRELRARSLTPQQIAEQLNREGLRTGSRNRFTAQRVRYLLKTRKISNVENSIQLEEGE